MTTYHFGEQKIIGEKGEKRLDAFFLPVYQITPATDAEQRKGIDRHFVNRGTQACLTVEYKTDAIANRTKRAFVETISVDARGKSGWAYSSQADWLIYFVPGDEIVYIIRFTDLRRRLPAWAFTYPVREALNDGYKTYGLLVPLKELEEIATWKGSLGKEQDRADEPSC